MTIAVPPVPSSRQFLDVSGNVTPAWLAYLGKLPKLAEELNTALADLATLTGTVDGLPASIADKIGGSLGSTDKGLPRASGTGGKTAQAGPLVSEDDGSLTGLILPRIDLTDGNQLTLANGANNDVALPDATLVEIIGPTGAYNITGFVAPAKPRLLILYTFVTAGALTISNENAGSAAANRIHTFTNADSVLTATGGSSYTLFYSTQHARWCTLAGIA